MSKRPESTPIPVTLKVLDGLSRLLLWGVVVAGLGLAAQRLVQQGGSIIKRVVVEGDTRHQTAVGLRPYLQAVSQLNFWTLNLNQVAQKISDVPWVRRVTVQRDFPAGLRLHIEEHQAVAWWAEANGNRLVNQFGEIFEATLDDAAAPSLPILDGPSERSADILRAYVALSERLKDSGMQAHALRLSPHGSWQATLDDQVLLALGRDDTQAWGEKLHRMNQTLSALRQHYDQALRSIDLRYPNGFAVSLHGVSVGPQL